MDTREVLLPSIILLEDDKKNVLILMSTVLLPSIILLEDDSYFSSSSGKLVLLPSIILLEDDRDVLQNPYVYWFCYHLLFC